MCEREATLMGSFVDGFCVYLLIQQTELERERDRARHCWMGECRIRHVPRTQFLVQSIQYTHTNISPAINFTSGNCMNEQNVWKRERLRTSDFNRTVNEGEKIRRGKMSLWYLHYFSFSCTTNEYASQNFGRHFTSTSGSGLEWLFRSFSECETSLFYASAKERQIDASNAVPELDLESSFNNLMSSSRAETGTAYRR